MSARRSFVCLCNSNFILLFYIIVFLFYGAFTSYSPLFCYFFALKFESIKFFRNFALLKQ